MTILSPSGPSTAGPEDRPVDLPAARGPLSGWLLHHLRRPVHDVGQPPRPEDHPITGEDSALALYLCYELHYLGLPEVDEALGVGAVAAGRAGRAWSARFERALIDLVGHPPVGLAADDVVDELRCLADGGDDGPSLSAHLETTGTLGPGPRAGRPPLRLPAQGGRSPHLGHPPPDRPGQGRRMLEIQRGEYGDGDPSEVHATLFAGRCRALGLDARYGALLDQVPAISLSTCNLISLFGLHRRWRGALVGHLALFEMCSVTPMGRYQRGLERLGLDEAATRFYAAHVVADEHHQVVALDDMVRRPGRGRAVPRRRGRVRGPGPAGAGVALRRARPRRLGARRDLAALRRPRLATRRGGYAPTMPRPVWTGSLSLRPGQRAREGVHRHAGPLRPLPPAGEGDRRPHPQPAVSDKTGKQVDADDIEMGYELRKGRYVTFEKDELGRPQAGVDPGGRGHRLRGAGGHRPDVLRAHLLAGPRRRPRQGGVPAAPRGHGRARSRGHRHGGDAQQPVPDRHPPDRRARWPCRRCTSPTRSSTASDIDGHPHPAHQARAPRR